MADRDMRKQSLYFKRNILEEVKFEADRLDRSLSWVVQRSCLLALHMIRSMPGLDGKPSPRYNPEAFNEVIK